jgi:RNA-directed DNA polymerase
VGGAKCLDREKVEQIERDCDTEYRNSVSCISSLHAAAKRDSQLRLNNLMHFITQAMLERAYRTLSRNAATGVDGLDWKSYGVNLTPKLQDLCQRLHRNHYKPQPVKRICIPKDNGQQRPIGITCLEDKIVQQALVWVMESIYENDFLLTASIHILILSFATSGVI